MTKQQMRSRKPLPAAISVLAALILFAGIFIRWWDERTEVLPAGTVQVHIIDAGNADASLITCGGYAMLIDAGESGDSDKLIAYIKKQGVSRLDCVIATHPHTDHIGGMSAVVNEFKPATFIMPFLPEEQTPTAKSYIRLLEALDKLDISVTEPEPGMSFTLGEASVEILGPDGTFSDENDLSVMCRIQNGSHRFLFTGDAGKAAENAVLASGRALRADVLKVGHHGSNGSSQNSFLDAVSPAYAVIPCGEGNSYGHPHEDTLSRLRLHNATVFRSDLNGNIVFTSDGNEITVEAQR